MTNPRPPLSPGQRDKVTFARMLLHRGDAAAAAEMLQPLVGVPIVHADIFFLMAQANKALGRAAEARRAFNIAINLDPGHAPYWTGLAEMLDQAGDLANARIAWERAWQNAPGDAAIALALVDLLIRQGDGAAAEAVVRQLLAKDPASLRARHALALALRLQGQNEAALAITSAIVDAGNAPVETQTVHAHLLAAVGEGSAAVDAYHAVLAEHPGLIDAQDSLARLLPQLGRGAEALDGYADALARSADDPALWHHALASARALKDYERLALWSAEAQARFPGTAGFAIFAAEARGHGGDPAAALAGLTPYASDDAGAAMLAAHWALAGGDAVVAARHAERATMLAPDHAAGWAYLGTAWRLMGDPRAGWLNDYDRLTVTMMLDVPPGYGSLADFLGELASALAKLHVLRDHPADQSLRGGTQTAGHLFLRGDPHITALGLQLHRQIEDWLATLPRDDAHPFLRRNNGQILFKHSWSVQLRNAGFHISHIHQDGWLSSAFYVALPPTVGSAGENDLPQGALALGEPDASLGLALPPERIIVPQPGMLALFPSYVWHGTTPFACDDKRLTVAFDAVPR